MGGGKGGGGKGDGGKYGGRGGKGGGKGGGKSSAPPGKPWDGPLPKFKKGNLVTLHFPDSDEGFGFIGDSFTRARRMESKKPWIGIRANAGACSGRVAFCFLNETGGNIRLGWSAITATIELGMDVQSFGFGGTGTCSHNGEYTKYGQSFGKNDVVTALVDFDKNTIKFMINEHIAPKDAFTIPREVRGMPLFPHVLVKEATFEVYFGPSQGTPPIFITPPTLPVGYTWISEAPVLHANPRTTAVSPQIVNASEAAEATKAALAKMLESKAKNQACHREQFEEWKVNVDSYARHFQNVLSKEKLAEKEQVVRRLQKPQSVLVKQGYGCSNLRIQVKGTKSIRGADMNLLLLTSRTGRIPDMAELGYGRCVLLSDVDGKVDMNNPRLTISGEVEEISRTSILVSTSYDYIPESPTSTYRCDLGPHITTYERIEDTLNRLQRQEPVHVGGRMGIFNPGTPVANTLFADIEASSKMGLVRDPSKRPIPNPESAISKAAAQPHADVMEREPFSFIPEMNPLNEFQMVAYNRAVHEKRQLSFIQGPPGTGKTYTAIEIVVGWLREKKGPVLVTAFSNKGTDNLAAGLYKRGIKVARIGAGMPAPWRVDGNEDKAIQRADVIAVTCIGAGMKLLRNKVFPFVVIDEAAQVMEPACMIPCSKGMSQCVMVGDQCQLPCTILSKDAEDGGLGVSLFERMLAVGMDMQILGIQYRMHALIAHFSSWRFYRGELKTGVECKEREHPYKSILNSPLGFCHVDGTEAKTEKTIYNTEEATAVAATAAVLFSKGCDMSTVCVITPYAGQVREIQRMLRAYLPSEHSLISVASVDSYQGQENDIILLSLVRSNDTGSIGFVQDWRRLNVSLTRAKTMCLLFGDVSTLSQHQLFRDWLGFHASLPKNTLSWCTWKHGSLHPMEDTTHLAQLVNYCQARFAESSAKDVRKDLPLQGDYPGMIVKSTMLKEEVKKDIDRRRRGNKAKLAIEPSVADKEHKVLQTEDSIFKSWVTGLASLQDSGGVGDWNEVTKLTKALGLALPEERRVDPADGLPYTKQDFLDAYCNDSQWNEAEPYSQPVASQPATPATPQAEPQKPEVKKEVKKEEPSGFPRASSSFTRVESEPLPQKEQHRATATEVDLLLKIKKATTIVEIEDLEKQLLQEKKKQKQQLAATRVEEKEKDLEAREEETRVDLTDGLLYTKADFIAQYGGTKEWDAAPLTVERRVDPADGLAYIKEDFIAAYNGTKEWDAAGMKKIEKAEEKRIDPADNMAYTEKEFMECYGSTEQWEAAAGHDEMPQRRRRRNR